MVNPENLATITAIKVYRKLKGAADSSYTLLASLAGTASGYDDKALTLAAGTRFYATRGLFLAAEIKYVPLKVKPLTEEVDLGGMRLALGIGYTFAL